MKHYKIIFLFLIIGVLITSSVALGAPARQESVEPELEGETFIYTPGEDEPLAITGTTDLVSQGTGGVSARKGMFSLFKYLGWGTVTRAKSFAAPTDEWVHIPVPMMTRLDGDWMYIKYVQFCAKSTDGANTKPIGLHLRSNNDLFGNYAITWPADNKYHCFGVSLNTWKESLGVSVKLHYADAISKITLYKVWVQVGP